MTEDPFDVVALERIDQAAAELEAEYFDVPKETRYHELVQFLED